MEFNPEPDTAIRAGDKLVVLGRPESLQAARSGAAAGAELMAARMLDGTAIGGGDSRRGGAGDRGVHRARRPPARASASCWSATIRRRRSTSATSCSRPARPGCAPISMRLPATASLDDLLAVVDQLNRSEVHDGILVQSPLPAAMGQDAERRVFDAHRPDKDVDGFHPDQRRPAGPEPRDAGRVHAVGGHRTARAHRAWRSPARAPSSSAAATSSASRWRCCCCIAHATVTICHSRTQGSGRGRGGGGHSRRGDRPRRHS